MVSPEPALLLFSVWLRLSMIDDVITSVEGYCDYNTFIFSFDGDSYRKNPDMGLFMFLVEINEVHWSIARNQEFYQTVICLVEGINNKFW